MNKLMRLIAWIFLFLVFLGSIAFSFFNTEPVPLSFGFVVLSPQPLSLWVVLAFAAGGLLGLLLGFGMSGNWRYSKSPQ
jgi:putative membrane protein